VENKIKRCSWCLEDTLYENYHDHEWGVPVHDEQRLFEFLILESFQAGLSWITILRKRENFRILFDQFDYKKVALFGAEKIKVLMTDPGIIRNRQKIEAAVNNAQRFVDTQNEHQSFSSYLWRFVEGIPIQNNFNDPKAIHSKTKLSETISKDLKQRGFQFVGPTVIYAFMQATGMVNDHLVDCFRYRSLQS
jgi:DNA-3-methyladenine glycosylase I